MVTYKSLLEDQLRKALLEQSKVTSKVSTLNYTFEIIDKLQYFTNENRLLLIQSLSSMYCDKCGVNKDNESCPCYAY